MNFDKKRGIFFVAYSNEKIVAFLIQRTFPVSLNETFASNLDG
jgi:hypothetical protein